jgi:histidine kinase
MYWQMNKQTEQDKKIKKLIHGIRQITKSFYGRTEGIQDGEIQQLADAIDQMAEQFEIKQNVLDEQRKEYQELFEAVPCLITVQNKDFQLLRFNHQFKDKFHPKKGDRCFQAYKNRSEPCRQCPVVETFKDGKSHISEQKGVSKDGTPSYWTLRTAPITNSKGMVTAVMEISVDITKQLIAEQQLIQAGKMATLGEMATGIAHELNQPLSVIKSASNFITKKAKSNEIIPSDIMTTLTEEIDGQVDRAAKIINHMREFGRKSDVIKEKAQVNDALTKAYEIFRQQLKLRQVEVIQNLQADLPRILADENRLEQIFINLLINARDAIEERFENNLRMKQAKSKEAKQIFLTTRICGNNVVIEIEDTGNGISESIADKIFEPFFTTKNVGKGTGLGLSISYGIIQDYNGTITVSKGRTGGALFIITFPLIAQ